MADKQGIITAMKHADLFLRVPGLLGATVRLNKNGGPFVITGGFNMVFQLTTGGRKWAFRVWHAPMKEAKSRYRAISQYLTAKKLPYFAEFIYDENGLSVDGELVDTVRMEWIEGMSLKGFLEKHLTDKPALLALAGQFTAMCGVLRANEISHGDLQDGNILIDTSGHLRLIDYDSVCIPSLEGQEEDVTGLKGYQHFSRFRSGQTSLKADYFSELIIDLSIVGIAEKNELWQKYDIKQSAYLLFSESDFENLEASEIYKDLKGTSDEIDQLLLILGDYLSTGSYLDLKPFPTYLRSPVIRSFACDKSAVINGVTATISWEVENARVVEMDNGIGKLEAKGDIAVKPEKDTSYRITATGLMGRDSKELTIRVFPIPRLQFIPFSIPDLQTRQAGPRFELRGPAFDLSFHAFTFEKLPLFAGPSLYAKTSPLYFSKGTRWNMLSVYERIKRKISR
jgi:hypothetical protein